MYELTKIIGPLDLTGVRLTDDLKQEFLLRGHITLDDQGDDYDPSDIVAGPIALIADGAELQLYAKVYDGPDHNVVKAHKLVAALKAGLQRFQFRPILGKTADGERDKFRVVLVQSADQRGVIKLTPNLSLETVVRSGKTVETSQDRL